MPQTQMRRFWCMNGWLLALAPLLLDNPAWCQIVPDGTLGNEGSRVTPNVQIRGGAGDRIDGGAQRGQNLFHSFREFNVGNGQRVYFANPADVRNILTRVTGNNLSNIQGTLGVDGNANLFLMNPNGIVFGPAARLDVNGSFVGTTANAIGFGTQGFFSTTDQQAPPLLTVQPSAFLFNQIKPGSIVNQSVAPNPGTNTSGLQVAAQHSFLLVGGDVTLDSGRLNNTGGRIELGGLAAPGTVGLQTNGDDLSLVFPNNTALANVNLTNDAQVRLTGDSNSSINVNANVLNVSNGGRVFAIATGAEHGANIIIDADTVNLSGISQSGLQSSLLSGTGTTGDGGDITVNSRSLNIRDQAEILGVSTASGSTGNIAINTDSLTISNGSTIQTSAYGQGNSGDIQINARGAVSIDGGTANSLTGINTVTKRTAGRSGNINITADSLSIANRGGTIATSVFGQAGSGDITINARDRVLLDNHATINSELLQGASGRVGNINITTGSLRLTNVASVNSLLQGKGVDNRGSGDININARDTISMDNSNISSGTVPGGSGRAGDISIYTGNLLLSNSSGVSTSSTGGDAGDITINTPGKTSLRNTSRIQSSVITSGYSVPSQGLTFPSPNISARSGNIVISTGGLSLIAQSIIGSDLYGRGQAGDIKINSTNHVLLDNGNIGSSTYGFDERLRQSGFDETLRSIGNAGAIRISADSMTLTNGSQIQSEIGNNSQGVGGDVTITLHGILSINGAPNADGSGGAILTRLDPGAIGRGGNLNINADSVILANGAELTANTRGQGNAGNIVVNAHDRVSLAEGSRILSNTQRQGDAGSITVNARGTVLLNNSSIDSRVNPDATGNGGDITIHAGTLTLDNEGAVVSASQGQGNAGNITATSRGRLSVLGGGLFTSSSSGQGNAGDITLNADRITLVGAAFNEANPDEVGGGVFSAIAQGGRGNGGRIRINTGSLSISNRAQLGSVTQGTGDAGDIEIKARNAISLDDGLINSSVNSGGVGRGGDITIHTQSLTATRGAQITTELDREQRDSQGNQSSGGRGKAGDIDIHASNSVLLSGSSRRTGASSGLVSRTGVGTVGNAGNIAVQTDDFRVDNGAVVAAGTANRQRGGNISVNAHTLEAINGGAIITNTSNRGNAGTIQLNIAENTTIAGIEADFDRRLERARAYVKTSGGQTQLSDLILNPNTVSGVFANTSRSSAGRGGSINFTTNRLNLNDGATITASSNGTGTAGTLNINAGVVQLSDNSSITTETRASNGGNITLQDLDLLSLRRNSSISSTAGTARARGNGGNINVDATAVVAVPSENSYITANAFSGQGGKVNVTTQGLFGIQPLDRQELQALAGTTDLTQLDLSRLPSSITAVSQASPNLSGQVVINSPDVDPSRGLVELPTIPVDASTQIAATCPTNTEAADRLGSFIISGRGGLPPSPTDLLSDENTVTDWVSAGAAEGTQVEAPPAGPAIVEAQGWVKDTNGEIQLVAGTSMAPASSPAVIHRCVSSSPAL